MAVRTGTGNPNYLLGDHLGSTSITANSSGGFVSEVRYLPFGQDRCTSGTTPTTYRFTGQRQEAGLGGPGGLYFFNARWLDPLTGRFASADSIVPSPFNPQSLNRYAYVLGNPLKYTDPSGHREDDGCEIEGCLPTPQTNVPPDVEIAGGIAFTADLLGYGLGVIEAGVTDFLGGLSIAGGCAFGGPPGCAAGYKTAFQLDVYIASTSPLGTAENGLGVIALLGTAYVDFRLGNTDWSGPNGPQIGVDTLVSARNAVAGLIPESNIDLAVSGSQLNYDTQRAEGTKPGGSVPLTNPFQLIVQVLFKDWW